MQNVNIIDNFYSQQDYGIMSHYLRTTNMAAVHQPLNVYYPSRLQGYPCWETNVFKEQEEPYHIFKNTFDSKSDFKIKSFETFFRKIIRSELEQSPYKGRKESLVHTDDTTTTWAGVVYFDSFSIRDGTRIYSYQDQIEPDIIVGSKPNRCIFYKASLFHSAGIDWRQEYRNVQIFFIKEGELQNAKS